MAIKKQSVRLSSMLIIIIMVIIFESVFASLAEDKESDEEMENEINEKSKSRVRVRDFFSQQENIEFHNRYMLIEFNLSKMELKEMERCGYFLLKFNESKYVSANVHQFTEVREKKFSQSPYFGFGEANKTVKLFQNKGKLENPIFVSMFMRKPVNYTGQLEISIFHSDRCNLNLNQNQVYNEAFNVEYIANKNLIQKSIS